ncbi:MAG: hypothetical protein K0R10_3045 [Alphaproteobacteria bacterium]|nr:hypothetical protein [Alphaproteobacteria bacterium]
MKEEFNNSSADPASNAATQAARDEARLDVIKTRIASVMEGESVVTFLEMNNVKIELLSDPINWAASTLTITTVRDGEYFYKDPKILLKRDLTDDNLLQAIVHETGHLNQHLSKVGNPDRILSEREYILFYRAAEADAQALCTEVTWALKQAGDAGPWNAACNAGYKDICDAYEMMVTADPSSIENGTAKRIAFDTWFSKPERLAGYNEATADNMIPFLAKGREIFKNHNMVEKPLDNTWVEKLDSASAKSYLLEVGNRSLLRDPYYSENTQLRPAPKKVAANNNTPAAPGDTPNPPVMANPF